MTAAIIYHAGCPDGHTAAWVAYKALEDRDERISAVYPVRHDAPPPDLTDVDTVYIVDFAYPHDTLVELTDSGKRQVIVLDHHRSAIDDIVRGIGESDAFNGVVSTYRTPAGTEMPYEVDLDVDRSGAGITWDYFHPGVPRLPLINYVEDRDLWCFALPHSEAVNAYIMAQPYTFDMWDDLAYLTVGDMADAGTGILTGVKAYCRTAAEYAYWCEMGGRTFPIVNVTRYHCSDAAGYLLDHFNVDMAAYYFDRGDGIFQYGFRSRKGVTVHDLAEQFGGGGHKQAAGCEVDHIAHTRIEGPA